MQKIASKINPQEEYVYETATIQETPRKPEISPEKFAEMAQLGKFYPSKFPKDDHTILNKRLSEKMIETMKNGEHATIDRLTQQAQEEIAGNMEKESKENIKNQIEKMPGTTIISMTSDEINKIPVKETNEEGEKLEKRAIAERKISTIQNTLDKNEKYSKNPSRKKIYPILNELFPNIAKHGEINKPFGLCIKENPGEFCMTTINYVAKDKISELQKKLDTVNELSKEPEKLKEAYTTQLNKGKGGDKGGNGGLGLMDMARKTKKQGNVFDYKISPDGLCTLTIKLPITESFVEESANIQN